jgi:RimJ/RimL family protein N-acetyltransferase
MKARLFNIDTVILTKRTVVHRFRENDGKAFFDLVLDNKSWIEDHLPKTVKAVTSASAGEVFIRQKLSDWLLQQEYAFGVWEEESAKLIGYIRVFNINWDVPKGEIGYFVDRKFSKKGFMTEALTSIIHFSFQQLKLEKLVLRTAMDNYPSQRLARKCGFRREGDLRSEFKKPSGEIIDLMLFGFTKSEYEKI